MGRGAPKPPAMRERQLAATILGMGLGAQIDLGLTDEYILEYCRDLLGNIRRAAADPRSHDGLDMIRAAAREGD